ncbi:sulfurtransferase [Alcaligenaceae bacterium SJ-26]|nr:sulfurtransferase [Alcaligenaceae bacterium SJ-26]
MTFLSRFFVLLLACSASAVTLASPLVTPAELNVLRQNDNVRIIDIRSVDAYTKNHIPGAVSAPYAAWRGPAASPGELPAVGKLTELVRSLGLDPDVRAIVVSSGENTSDFGAAARVYWTLKYLGLNDLSILNGGVQAWADAGLPQDDRVVQVAASSYEPVLNDALIATQADVQSSLDSPTTRLVDARPANFFRGEVKAPTASVPGTIRGAVNLEHERWFKPGSNQIVSAEEAKQIAHDAFESPADETISFCNTGHWAATDWFALSELAGQENVRLYPASLAEWTQAEQSLPMDNVPGRGSQLMDKLKGLLN